MAKTTGAKSKKAKSALKPSPQSEANKANTDSVAEEPKKYKASLLKKDRFIRPKNVSFNPLPNVIKLSVASLDVLWKNKRLFLGITLIDGILNLIFVQGLVNSLDISTLETNLRHTGSNHSSAISTSVNAFTQLLGSAGGSTSSTGAYEFILVIITSLAVIWSLRQVYSAKNISLRDSYYRSMYPLVPFVLVLAVLIFELIPAIVGASVYSIVVSNGIAIGGIEKFVWFIVFMFGVAISFYLVCSTLFALYVVTLPDMTPLKAMRSARQLVRYRRLVLLRKILWLPFALLIAVAAIMLPVILWVTALTQWVYFILSLFALVIANSYIYNLYRELLNE